jgi:hypothetical protein
VHGDGAVTVHRRAFAKSATLGAVLQLAIAGLGHLIPALRDAGLFPIGGTLVGGFAGLRLARRSAGIPTARALGRGGMAGAVGGALGALASTLLGDVPPNTIFIAGMSTLVAGFVGGVLGRILPQARTA